MKTILVLAQNPELPDAVKSALEGYPCRSLVRPDIEEAEPLLRSGSLHACLLDADPPQIQLSWMIDRLKELVPQLPILVLAQSRSPDWEEALYLKGVRQVLSKPLRPRLLRHFLDEIPAPPTPSAPPSSRRSSPPHSLPAAGPPPSDTGDTGGTEAMLADLTQLLPCSFSVAELCSELLPKLRRSLGLQRAVILVRPSSGLGSPSERTDESRRFSLAAACGLAAGLLESFSLSPDQGAGALLVSAGPVLQRDAAAVSADPQAAQEMDLLGVETLIAMMQGDQMVGALGVGRRVTGEPLGRPVLSALYYLCEQVAQAVGQIWATERVMANHEMMEGILRELSSACVVVGRDLQLLHANKAAQSLFRAPDTDLGPIKLADLPSKLVNRIFQTLRTGQLAAPFRYRHPETGGRQFLVSIIPFQSKAALTPLSALIVLDDQTQSEQLRKLEVEAANLRLVRIMADRLAHEIGNALVPVSTHQQLLPTRHKDPEFRMSLESALASSVKRIGRLVNQMVFLAQDRPVTMEVVQVPILLEEAFREALRHLPNQTASMRQNNDSASATVLGDHEALKHALAEVFINAIQANPAEARVNVRTAETLSDGRPDALSIEVKDNGEGFGADSALHATEAFFTTRSVGLGLGLTVAQKVIEVHQGRLEVIAGDEKTGGMIRITLPLEQRRLI